MKVWKLIIDKRTDTPVVLLQEAKGKRVLPIWIGHAEAKSILMELLGEKFPRPLTHDLIKTIVQGLEARISKVVISDLKDNTFFATLYVERGDEVVAIDARPSDSIAVALRTKAPIHVAEDLLKTQPTLEDLSDDERAEALRKYLDGMNPEDFGKFPG